MAAYGELNLSILGLIYMFTSETGEAIRLVMTQVRGLVQHTCNSVFLPVAQCSGNAVSLPVVQCTCN